MQDFESLHYEGDWGKLCSEDGELASVPDLVRVLMHGGTPGWNAVDAVLDRVGRDANARGYITHPHKHARPIGSHGELQLLIERLRSFWKMDPAPADWQSAQRSPGERFERRLYTSIFDGQFAIHLDDAHRLFKDELLTAVRAGPGGALADDEAQGSQIEEASSASAGTRCGGVADRRRAAVARLDELGEVRGARSKVANEFKVAVRTIGKWIKSVDAETTEKRKATALSSAWGAGLSGVPAAKRRAQP